MKRIFAYLLTVSILLLSLAGCQAAPPKEEGTSLPAESSEAPTPSEEARPLPDESNEETTGEPAPAISLHSMDDLQKMRDMCASAEEDELEKYLCSIEGGGATSRKDLETFLEAVDSLPLLSLVEGDIPSDSSESSFPSVFKTIVPCVSVRKSASFRACKRSITAECGCPYELSTPQLITA